MEKKKSVYAKSLLTSKRVSLIPFWSRNSDELLIELKLLQYHKRQLMTLTLDSHGQFLF